MIFRGILGKKALRSFARKLKKPLKVLNPEKAREKEIDKFKETSFFNQDDEDIYVLDTPLSVISQKPIQSVATVLIDQFMREEIQEKLSRLFNVGKSNDEIIQKIRNFPLNFISSDYPELEKNLKQDTYSEELQTALHEALERSRIENMILSIPTNTRQKIVKSTSKSRDTQLQSFKMEIVSQGLIPLKDIDLLEKLTWDQFEKYSKVENPSLPVLEENAITKMVSSNDENEVMRLLDLPSSNLDDEMKEFIDSDIDFLKKDRNLVDPSQAFDYVNTLTLKDAVDVQVVRLQERFGMPEKLARQQMKEYVFLKKKEEEENKKLIEKNMKMERKREIKRQQKEINNKRLEFQEFDELGDKLSKKMKEDYGGMVRLNKNIEIDKFTSGGIKERAFNIFKLRTTMNVDKVILNIIENDQNGFYSFFTNKGDVGIDEIILNDGITVAKIYWYFSIDTSQSNIKDKSKQEQIALLEPKLNNYGKRKLSPILFTQLGLKKPIEIRFIYTNKVALKTVTAKNLRPMAIQKTNEQLQRKIKEGELKESEVTQDLWGRYYQKNLEKLKDILHKGFTQPSKELANVSTERKRFHKNPDGSRNRTKNKNKMEEKIDKFWSSLNQIQFTVLQNKENKIFRSKNLLMGLSNSEARNFLQRTSYDSLKDEKHFSYSILDPQSAWPTFERIIKNKNIQQPIYNSTTNIL